MRVSRNTTRCLGTCLWTLVMVTGPLTCPGNHLSAQEPVAGAMSQVNVTPEQQRELNQLLTMTVPQQRVRAKELIEKFPDSDLAVVLQRLLEEYETFGQIHEVEQLRRESYSEWARVYWHSKCCPPPPWDPPVGRIVNETGIPVLYEQRLEGIDRSRWSGPYRLTTGDHASPHPYHVRYLVAGTLRVQQVLPGETYAFRGSPADGSLELVPSTAAPFDMITPPPPGAVEAPSASADLPPADEAYDYDPSAELDGPMIVP